MDIIDLLAGDNYILYNKTLAKHIGVENAILFGAMCSYQRLFKGGEFYREQAKIMEDTCLTEYLVRKGIKELKELGLLTVTKKSMPAKYYFKVNTQGLVDLLVGEGENAITSSGAKFDTTSGAKFDTTAININNIYYNNNKKVLKKDLDTQTEKQVESMNQESTNCEKQLTLFAIKSESVEVGSNISNCNNELGVSNELNPRLVEPPTKKNQANTKLGILEREDLIEKLFEKTWRKYIKKKQRAKGLDAYRKLMNGRKTEDEVKDRARQIDEYVVSETREWAQEKQGKGRELEFVPLFASFINAEFKEKRK